MNSLNYDIDLGWRGTNNTGSREKGFMRDVGGLVLEAGRQIQHVPLVEGVVSDLQHC